MRDLNERRNLAAYGVHMLDQAVYLKPEWGQNLPLAMDAQPQLISPVNAGIPAFLANIVDPEVIKVVLQPLRAVEIAGGEVKKGDWTTLSYMMPQVEPAGGVVSYGDYDNGGNLDTNIIYVARQPYHYQTIKRMGDQQVAEWAVAAIDYSAQLDYSKAVAMGRFQNRSYFYGVSGLQNYGLLNDPSLPVAITPATKAAGGTTWALATANEEYNDVLALYTQLQTQMGGNLEMTDRMELILSTARQPALAKLSTFNVSAAQMIRENFPNLTIRAVPEYSTPSGELMQLIVQEYDGTKTIWAAFTEKMRAFPAVRELSAMSQKFMGGTWGAIIRRPLAIASMLGI